MMTTLKLQNVGQIKQAELKFGDLTVLVGPQATGKSITLQFLKLLVDTGNVQEELRRYGLDWSGSLPDFLDVYFGEWMRSIWKDRDSAVTWNAKPVDMSGLIKRKRKTKAEALFFIPAQRVLALRDGWPRPFTDYTPGDPFAVREFSEKLRVLVEQEFTASESLFPQEIGVQRPGQRGSRPCSGQCQQRGGEGGSTRRAGPILCLIAADPRGNIGEVGCPLQPGTSRTLSEQWRSVLTRGGVMKKILLFLLLLVFQSPQPTGAGPGLTQNEYGVPQYSEVQTGGVRMIQVDGQYNVWTKKVGDSPIKVLLLHGGPGFGHEYLECFESFLPQAGIEFYYYAQLGNYNSDQPADTTLWTIDRYREEVEQVRQGLGLEDFYLFGQSWGGMLGMEYALKYQQHLKGLVISNMTASIDSYTQYTGELKSRLPAEVIATMDKYESAGQYEAPEYQELIFSKIYSQYICRLDPWPEPMMRSLKHFNMQIYNTMQGPNEFVVTGNFKDWNVWDKLPAITVPTLVIGAKYDEMNPADIEKMASLIPHSRLLICAGSHMSMYDDQQNYFSGLIKFLKDVQAGHFK